MPDLEELADLDDEPIFLPQRQHHVTAIVVSHEGAVWLPAVLTQLSQQVRPPQAVVAVDTGSTDTSVTLLRQSLGEDRVIEADAQTTYSAAVDLGVAAAPEVPGDVVQWLWLLHDDSAPQDACLEKLLQAADTNSSVAILGPKILGWHDRRLLLEVGVSVTGSGRRYTGLERREHDQGQHDGFRDVLSVSSAGMLIRRDVWDRLRGFDPNLPLFRNDLDLCWRAHRAGERVVVVTDAVLHHREASAHGRRAGVGHTHPQRSDRAAAAQVLLAQAPGWARPFIALRLFAGGSARSLASLIGKDITSAQDEIGALASVARHPGRVRSSVTLVAETTTEPAGVVRSLRPKAGTQLRQALETVTGVITTSSAPNTAISALDSGPVDDDAMYLEQSSGWARRVFLRPSVLLVLALTVVAVVATRGLWVGPGVLQGGSLLPAPDGAMDVWQLYTQAWHNVGTGSDVPAPPYLMVVFAVAALLLGKAPLAVAVISLLSIPMAGWAAYFTLRGVIRSTPIRVWAAVAYAFLPAVSGAVSSGRIGTSIAAIVLPFAARSMVRICRRHGTMRRAAGTALLIAAVSAAVPGLWLLFLVIAAVVVGWLLVQREPDIGAILRRLALALFGSLILLLPWSWHVVTNPVVLLLQSGAQSARLADPNLDAVDVLLLHPGGPGMTPTWATAGLIVAGLLALLRNDRLATILAVWAVGIVALIFGVVQTSLLVTPPGATVEVRPWPGPATLVLGAAMIVAAALAVDGLRERMAGANFSILQPLAGLLVVAAISAPVLSAVWWVPIGEGVMRKAPQSVVPAFVAAEAQSPQAPRTLVLRQDRAGNVSYSLVNGAGPVLGEADVNPPAEIWEQLDPYVAALAAGLGGDEVQVLAAYGVRYVLLAAGTSSELIPVIDGEPGVRRLATSQGEILWRISGVTSRARVVADGQQVLPVGVNSAATLSADPYINQPLPDGTGERTLVLGVTPSSGWTATVDDAATDLTRAQAAEPYAWSAAFDIPDGPAPVTVAFDDGPRNLWLLLQLAVFVTLIILALPARQREDPDPDLDEVELA